MALLGLKTASEVGLRSLLRTVDSTVVLRTACCSVGIVLPVYSTFEAIERNDQNEQEKWLTYWAAYGPFRLVETCADKLLYRFPMYYRVKLAFLVWLQLPSVDGAKQLYKNHLCPFLLRRRHWVDPIMTFVYGKMRENETVSWTSADERSTTAARTRSSIRVLQEVGLRLLPCLVCSSDSMQTVCYSAEVVLPVYPTFEAIERQDEDKRQKWLTYWAAYGSFSLVDVFADKLLSRFPMYYRMKFALLLWLQLPSVEGAKQLYKNCLRPIFLRHQVWVDTIMGFANGEMMANETVRSTRADERIRTTFMARTSSIRAHEEMANETVRSTRADERIRTTFMARTSSIRAHEEMANETVRSARADERIRTTFMAGTSSIRAHEEGVNETVRSTRENERSSIREPNEGKFDGSNGIVGCVICLEQLLGGDEVTGMPCSHVFHVKCIEKWLKQSRSCPLCRFDLP